MLSETKICQNCKKDFTIEPNDFGFYEKIGVPPPTFCPECRRIRRWAWRNNMSLYNRKCDLCGKSVISIYPPERADGSSVRAGSPDSGIIVYCNKCWWSDQWDPKSYGVDYDFSRPFFTQFSELMRKVPHMAIVNDDGIASLNCEYTHDWWFSKNCYMCLSGWYVENVMYSFFILSGKNILDSLVIRTSSEWLYECFITSKSYQVKFAQLCLSCIDSQFIYDCRNCSNCLMCTGLRGKKYHYKNKEYSKKEYKKILENYKLDTWSGQEEAKKEFQKFILSYPRKCPENLNCLLTTGEYNSYSKYLKNCFYGKNAEKCSYCEFFGDNSNPTKDSYDTTMTGGASLCYETVVGDHSERNFFCVFSPKNMDVQYTQDSHSSKHLFGCVGIRNAKYCILNKEYSKEAYEQLVKKISEHMNEMPYKDHLENSYAYGEFFPVELSPFGYNETNATELLPLTRAEAQKRGYHWQDNIQHTVGKETLIPENIPESINDVSDSILDEVLVCINCQRNYKIIQNEFNFYKKMQIPIPRKCFFCRHADRIAKRNPFKLWHRRCMCEKPHPDHLVTGLPSRCPNEFETSYASNRPEIVYCEKCYQQEIY